MVVGRIDEAEVVIGKRDVSIESVLEGVPDMLSILKLKG
jgi:hypothetical protein